MKFTDEIKLQSTDSKCGEIKIGDTIKWEGQFYEGFQSGINKVVAIIQEGIFIWIRLDNENCLLSKTQGTANTFPMVGKNLIKFHKLLTIGF